MAIFRQTFVIDSRLPPQEAWKKLFPVVRTSFLLCAQCGQRQTGHFCSRCGEPAPPPIPQTWIQRNFSSGGFEFEGDLSTRDFNINRIISYRNACLPDIRGRFEPCPAGTRIVVEMKMNPLGYIFLGGATTIPFLVLSLVALTGQGLPATGILAFVASCFFFAVCWIAFAAEASTARTALSRLWQ